MRYVAAALVLAGLAVSGYAQDAITPKEPTPLFNGKDLEGWHKHLSDANADPDKTWSVKDGILHCTGTPSGYIRTEQAYRDYVLFVEWRWPEGGGNNGVLVHMSGEDVVWPKSIECQLRAGDAGDFWVIGGTDFAEHTNKDERRVENKVDGAEKPLGEWNTMKIVAEGDTLTVFVNDQEVNKATKTTVQEGKICLQSEGKPIEFRRVEIQPLPKAETNG